MDWIDSWRPVQNAPARFSSQPRMPEQVSKLKNEAGNAFTGRMEAMFNDMRVSIDTNESFREYSENSHDAEAGAQARKDGGVELVAHVLTTGCWPSVSAKQEVRVQHVLPQLESRVARKKGELSASACASGSGRMCALAFA